MVGERCVWIGLVVNLGETLFLRIGFFFCFCLCFAFDGDSGGSTSCSHHRFSLFRPPPFANINQSADQDRDGRDRAPGQWFGRAHRRGDDPTRDSLRDPSSTSSSLGQRRLGATSLANGGRWLFRSPPSPLLRAFLRRWSNHGLVLQARRTPEGRRDARGQARRPPAEALLRARVVRGDAGSALGSVVRRRSLAGAPRDHGCRGCSGRLRYSSVEGGCWGKGRAVAFGL